jgi:hypothetical protein
MPDSRNPLPGLGFVLRALFVIATLVFAARTAHADEPARVRVRLHARPRSDAGATYVEINVAGTEAPIRLVRRVPGACIVDAAANESSLVRVSCDGDVRFEVRRESDAVLVRRSVIDTEQTDASDGWIVIARAAIARNVALQIDAPAN